MVIINKHMPVGNHDAGACLFQVLKTDNVDFKSGDFVVGSDLAGKYNLFTAKRPPGTQGAAPDTVKTHQLPDCVHTQTPWLHRISWKMALEIPGIQPDILLSNDLSPAALFFNGQNSVQHQKGRCRQACVKIFGRIFNHISI